MSVKHRLRTLTCCAMLEAAALMGMPMRPEHVQDLMRSLNQPKIACTHPDESDRGEGPVPFSSRIAAVP